MESFVGWKKFKNIFSGRKYMFIKWLIIFCISIPAWGYNLTQDFINGFYWASLPINIVVVDSDANRKSQLIDLAENAIKEWETQSGLSLWDLTSSGTSNIIRWSTNFGAETKMDPSSVLAVAIRYTNGPYFAKTEIIINGQHNSFNTPNAFINRMNVATTLVHELGHTMGLDHSNDMNAIMAPTLQTPYPGLNSDDVRGLSDAHSQTEHRQLVRYVSPLAYGQEKSTSQPLSCGTIGTATAASGSSGLLSLSLGMLIGFVRKIYSWFKSRF
jgi:hypothetical protein